MKKVKKTFTIIQANTEELKEGELDLLGSDGESQVN